METNALPATIFFDAIYITAISPVLNIAFCAKFRKAKLEDVFREAASKFFMK